MQLWMRWLGMAQAIQVSEGHRNLAHHYINDIMYKLDLPQHSCLAPSVLFLAWKQPLKVPLERAWKGPSTPPNFNTTPLHPTSIPGHWNWNSLHCKGDPRLSCLTTIHRTQHGLQTQLEKTKHPNLPDSFTFMFTRLLIIHTWTQSFHIKLLNVTGK